MASKTWKLGEVCRGGIITVQTTKTKITIIGKEWDYAKGCNRGSDQSNAKEWTRLEVSVTNSNVDTKIRDFLNDLTTSYHCGQIREWLESKVDFKRSLFW